MIFRRLDWKPLDRSELGSIRTSLTNEFGEYQVTEGDETFFRVWSPDGVPSNVLEYLKTRGYQEITYE